MITISPTQITPASLHTDRNCVQSNPKVVSSGVLVCTYHVRVNLPAY